MKPVCVVPTVRPQLYESFLAAWDEHFRWHRVDVVTVWDGDSPRISYNGVDQGSIDDILHPADRALIFNRTDAVRNAGFLWAAQHVGFDAVVTLDDDVRPLPDTDPIGDLLEPLHTRVPISWLNTLLGGEPFVRGIPYAVRAEAEVHLSHANWVTVPDYDGPTQLYLTPQAISKPQQYQYPAFYVGPIPKGVYSAVCGMSIAFTARAAPHMYFAPMNGDTGFHRFGDIWMGIAAKKVFDANNWAFYYGSATVSHSRASDVYKNCAQEAEGIRVNETWWSDGDSVHPYFQQYRDLRNQYAMRMADLLNPSGTV